jgi:hypothetical protein
MTQEHKVQKEKQRRNKSLMLLAGVVVVCTMAATALLCAFWGNNLVGLCAGGLICFAMPCVPAWFTVRKISKDTVAIIRGDLVLADRYARY